MKDIFSDIKNNSDLAKTYRLKVSMFVAVLFVVGALLNIPFSRALKELKIESGDSSIVQNSVLTDVMQVALSSLVLGSILTFIGIWLSIKTRLGAPLITSMFSKFKLNATELWKSIGWSMGYATITAVMLLGVFHIQKIYYPVEGILDRPDKFYYFFVSFSAGITEEIIFRLCLLSIIVAVFQWISKSEQPTNPIMWSGILITGIFFGLIHLPLSQNFNELTLFTVGMTMIGNLITGTLYGWIYWKRGLLIAIIAHVTFDLVFHVIGSPYV